MPCALLAAGSALAAVPLPPEKPKSVAGAAAAPLPKWPRAVPLPLPRPAELIGEEEEEEGAEPSRLAARSAPEADPQPSAPGFAPPPAAPPEDAGPAAEGGGEGAQGAAPDSAGLPPACAALVADGTMVATRETSVAAKGSCGLPQPVRLTGVRLDDGRLVELRPAAISRCQIAAAVVSWVREDLAPAIGAAGGALSAVRIAASYDCRSRNRIPGARMSEHGLGNAVDVGGFELADAGVWKVEKAGLPPRLRAAMKESACRRFTTVLGPGSDGYHEDHVHVDLAQRRLDIRLCRWNLDAGTAVASGKAKDGGKAKEGEKPKGAAVPSAPAPAAAGSREDGAAKGDPKSE